MNMHWLPEELFLPHHKAVDLLSTPSWKTIVALVAMKHDVMQRDLLGRSRFKYLIAPRHEAMALIFQHTKASRAAIGRYFGRDHTTIIYALKKTGADRKLVERPTIHLKPASTEPNYRHKLRGPFGKFLPLPSRRGGRPLDGKGPSIRKGYIAGRPVKEIAAELGISEGCVRVRAHRMGLEHPHPHVRSSAVADLGPEQADDYLVLTQKGGFSAAEAIQKVVGT